VVFITKKRNDTLIICRNVPQPCYILKAGLSIHNLTGMLCRRRSTNHIGQEAGKQGERKRNIPDEQNSAYLQICLPEWIAVFQDPPL
jgi:hypothetical protein